MSRRLVVTAAIVIWSLTGSHIRSAAAQERAIENAPVTSNLSITNAAAKAVTDPALPVVLPEGFKLMKERSYGLLPFYVSSAVLQALDVHSTFKVIARGGREGNPMLAGFVNNKPAFIAVKGAIAAGSMFAVNRIAKKNKFAAMAISAAMNSVYSMVVSHNYKLAASLR